MDKDFQIEILRYPSEDDWMRAKTLACNTVGLKAVNMPNEAWKEKLVKSEHSPQRTLMFTIRMTIPYYVSVHFCRHKYGVEHFVTTQRNDRQKKYDRTEAPQGQTVVHIMDINATELIFMAHRRLCTQADPFTQRVMAEIKRQVMEVCPAVGKLMVPQCEYLHECPEFFPCGKWQKTIHMTEDKYNKLKNLYIQNVIESGGTKEKAEEWLNGTE